MMETIFVYGTLKEGYGNHYLLTKALKVGKAETDEKYSMYEMGIPFVVKDEKDTTIKGEVYLVDTQTFRNVDLLEGHPICYRREKIKVNIEIDKRTRRTNAWIYFYPFACGNKVNNGIYKKR